MIPTIILGKCIDLGFEAVIITLHVSVICCKAHLQFAVFWGGGGREYPDNKLHKDAARIFAAGVHSGLISF